MANVRSDHEFRVRVGMMNPDSIRPILQEVIEAYAHPRIFKFLHIPVQSGDDQILSAMRRRYNVKEFLDIINNFRSEIRELTVSTDLIVGYPGETDEQFRHSVELIEELRPNIVNITRFSPRPGTPAAKLANKLPGRLVKSRSREMTKLRFRISRELNKKEMGRKHQLLVVERVKPGSVLGRTDNYLPVVIKHDLALGSWVENKIVDATDSYLIGELTL